jgi:pantothenate kinase-related protein Tda10
MTRPDVVAELASRIGRVTRPHPIRVVIDGVDAAGKTTLADELVAPLTRTGRFVIRASIDGFHHLADVRYRRGRLSLERYVPGRRLYLAEAQPERHDSVVVDNNDVADPRLGGL